MTKKNAGTGKAFTFHGSFTSKLAAKKKEARTPGSFIEVRDGRYYVLKPKRIRNVKKSNPGVIIYDQITRVEGTKGNDSQFPGQRFFHNFKRPYPVMVGLPDGSLLIRSKK
jgi:hypothetical protein